MSRKKRGRKLLAVLLGLGVLAVIAIILVIVLIITITRPDGEGPKPPPKSSESSQAQAQPADCPDVQVIVTPGSLESSATDNPQNPTSHPRSLMLKVSKPLQQKFEDSRADVWTTPYMAQPPNLGQTDMKKSYQASRGQGMARVNKKLSDVNAKCPLTNYLLMGFSQGAMITGNIANAIGNGKGPVPADRVLGVALLADSRTQAGIGKNVGPSAKGNGPEVVLGTMQLPGGTSMQGARQGGFGALNDRTFNICAPGDLVCDSPQVTNPIEGVGKLLGAVNNPVHGVYATTRYWKYQGGPATAWMLGYATRTITDAPRPKRK